MFIRDFCSVTEQRGEVGIEIEVEGRDLPYEEITGWRREEDGSLRGESCEFVLNRPCVRGSVGKYLSRIYDAYDSYCTEVIPSTRQSVHIHINVQEMTITQIYTFILTFIIFEELLVDYCGEGRTGNLFCLRAKDAEYFINMLRYASNKNNFTSLDTNRLRYSAVNVASLFKYGSLEFRSMRGGTSQSYLETWVEMLLSIKDYALTKEDPRAMATDFREMDIEEFIDKVFGVNSVLLKKTGYENSVRYGARLIKMIAYSGDWVKLSEEYEKPVPSQQYENPITGIEVAEAASTMDTNAFIEFVSEHNVEWN